MRLPVHLHGHHFHVLYKGYEDAASIQEYRQAIQAFSTPGSDLTLWNRFKKNVVARSPAKPLKRDALMAEK
jgi:iron transport multicopper oxidase